MLLLSVVCFRLNGHRIRLCILHRWPCAVFFVARWSHRLLFACGTHEQLTQRMPVVIHNIFSSTFFRSSGPLSIARVHCHSLSLSLSNICVYWFWFFMFCMPHSFTCLRLSLLLLLLCIITTIDVVVVAATAVTADTVISSLIHSFIHLA